MSEPNDALRRAKRSGALRLAIKTSAQAKSLAMRVTAAGSQAFDPSPLVARRVGRPVMSGVPTLLSIYREKNLATALSLAAESSALGFNVRLWSLDTVPGPLKQWTRGVGPGQRLELLNRLGRLEPISGDLIIADDDFRFVRGSLSSFLAVAKAARLDIAQPCHDYRSYASHVITRRRALSIARSTGFVETGPMVYFSADAARMVTPFPEEFGMGWGIELVWSDLAHSGLSLGIVDATPIRHLGMVAAEYDASLEWQRVRGLLNARGLTSLTSTTITTAPWRTWQRRKPRVQSVMPADSPVGPITGISREESLAPRIPSAKARQ